MIEGSLEVKLPTIWTDEKQRWEESEKRRDEERRSKKRKSQKKEDPKRESLRRKKMQMREKVGKSRNTVFLQWFVGSGGSKSRLAKAAGAEPAGQMRDWKIARRCGAKHMSKSKCTKHTRFGALFHAEISKKCTLLWREAHFEVELLKTQHYTTCLDHFWRFRCRFAWQAPGILHLAKSEQDVRVLWHV